MKNAVLTIAVLASAVALLLWGARLQTGDAAVRFTAAVCGAAVLVNAVESFVKGWRSEAARAREKKASAARYAAISSANATAQYVVIVAGERIEKGDLVRLGDDGKAHRVTPAPEPARPQ